MKYVLMAQGGFAPYIYDIYNNKQDAEWQQDFLIKKCYPSFRFWVKKITELVEIEKAELYDKFPETKTHKEN